MTVPNTNSSSGSQLEAARPMSAVKPPQDSTNSPKTTGLQQRQREEANNKSNKLGSSVTSIVVDVSGGSSADDAESGLKQQRQKKASPASQHLKVEPVGPIATPPPVSADLKKAQREKLLETINKAIVRNQQQDQQIMVPHSVQPSPTDSPVMATNPRQSVGSSGSELHPPLSIRRSNSYNGSAALRQVVTSSSGGGELLVVGRSTFSGQIPLPSIARAVAHPSNPAATIPQPGLVSVSAGRSDNLRQCTSILNPGALMKVGDDGIATQLRLPPLSLANRVTIAAKGNQVSPLVANSISAPNIRAVATSNDAKSSSAEKQEDRETSAKLNGSILSSPRLTPIQGGDQANGGGGMCGYNPNRRRPSSAMAGFIANSKATADHTVHKPLPAINEPGVDISKHRRYGGIFGENPQRVWPCWLKIGLFAVVIAIPTLFFVLMFLTGNFAGHALTQLGNNTMPPVGQPQTTSPPNQQASTNTGGGGNGGTVNIVISPISR